MRKLFTILFLGTIFLSCSRDEEPILDETTNPLITNIKIDLNKSGNWINTNEIDFYFEYDHQEKLVKKIGGFVPISSSSGFNGAFSKNVFTTLVYSNQNVLVENFSSSAEFSVLKETKNYSLNSQNQILTKEIPSAHHFLNKKLNFTYADNKLVEIVTTFPNMPYDPNDPNDYIWTYIEKFYYDSKDNLIKTEFFNQNNGTNVGEKITRTFENYDSSINPTKKFFLLDEYFYRSLSKNNFRKYTEKRYNYDELVSTSEIIWGFNYDSNGNMIVN